MARIGAIRCPVLVVSSDQDYTPVDFKRSYAAMIPGAEVMVIPDSRHAAPLDQPVKLNRIISGFLARLNSSVPQ